MENNNVEFPNPDKTDDDYFNLMPAGFKFCPTDEEIITCYLRPKLENRPLPRNRIPEVNLYALTPQQLSAAHKIKGRRSMYFFTSTTKKYPKGSRPSRSAGSGYWKASGADNPIVVEGQGRIGVKKTLCFYQGPARNTDGKTLWKMHEYRVPRDTLPPKQTSDPNNNQLDEWVLCKVYERKPTALERKKAEEQRLLQASAVGNNNVVSHATNLNPPLASPEAGNLPPSVPTTNFHHHPLPPRDGGEVTPRPVELQITQPLAMPLAENNNVASHIINFTRLLESLGDDDLTSFHRNPPPLSEMPLAGPNQMAAPTSFLPHANGENSTHQPQIPLPDCMFSLGDEDLEDLCFDLPTAPELGGPTWQPLECFKNID